MHDDDVAPAEANLASPAAEARDVSDAPPPRHSRGDVDFAVVVGVNHYAHIKRLNGAIADATEFHRWLCEPTGGRLDLAQTVLITSDPLSTTPLQHEIDEALDKVLQQVQALGGARRFYFYFAGHGAMSHSGANLALLLTRWSHRLIRIALSTDDYRDHLKGVGLFKEVAIFLDCCCSTSIAAVPFPPAMNMVKAAIHPTQIFLAYAAEQGTQAYETRDQDDFRGIFTRVLLAILREPNGPLSAAELKDRLERDVTVEAARCGGIQQRAYVENGFARESHFERPIGEGGPGPSIEHPFLELRFPKRRGEVKLLNGARKVTATHVIATVHGKDTPTWRLRLPAGLYKLEGGGLPPSPPFEHTESGGPHEL
jgi:hypothetical protein